MIASRLSQYWTLITILLVAIIAIGGIVAWVRYSPSHPIEISMPPGQEVPGKIYIGGNVTNPGFYPVKAGDCIEALIQAAGGATSSANLSELKLKLYILETGEEQEPQKIDINRAEAWLLETLPGIGETKAQAIIAYREQNGPFHNINELTRVKGIGVAIYEKIKHLITVAD